MEGIVFDCGKDESEDSTKNNTLRDADPSSVVSEREFKSVYLPPEEIERMREIYSHSIVQDFDDTYHMSKEDQIAMQEKYGLLIQLRKTRKKTRRIDKYVETHRLCMDILDQFAETNGIYSPKEFKKLVLTGKIYINGLTFPKLQGKGRKNINWDYITSEYIENRDSDPKDLLHEDDDEDVGESFEENAERYFGGVDKLEALFEDRPEKELIKESRTIINPDKDDFRIAINGTKKSRKDLVKASPNILEEIKRRDKLNRRNSRVSSYHPNSYLTDTEFEIIEEYDAKRKYGKNNQDSIPQFKGDITNKDDFKRYEFLLDEYERENTFINYHGKAINIDELNEIRLKEEMEKNEWDIRKVYYDKKEHKRIKQQRKKDKKKEKRLKEMLLEIQNRKKSREEKITGINTKRKKMSKKKKKKTKKKHKKDLDFFDGVLTDINSSNKKLYKSYKKYKDEMEDWTWKK